MNTLYKNTALSLSVLAMVAVFGCKKDPECLSSNPALYDPIKQGRQDGENFRDTEIAAGTAAGQALTKEDGRYDGRAELYAATYNTAYQAAYNAQYIVGDAAGNQNAQSIADGAAAGTAAGGVDGCAQAKSLGYKQGCNEGKAIGQYAAQNGAIDCQWLAGSFKKERPVEQKDKDRCYKDAYDDVVGSNPAIWRNY